MDTSTANQLVGETWWEMGVLELEPNIRRQVNNQLNQNTPMRNLRQRWPFKLQVICLFVKL